MAFVKANSTNLPHVDIFMIHEFLKKDDRFNISEVKGSKASNSMRESYGDNAIGYVELKRENDICSLRAQVCPEHRVKSSNYVVELIIEEKEEIIKDVYCNTCPAATGGCKHALAFLMWTHRRSEEPSPTEVTSYWLKPVLSKIGTSLKFIEAKDFLSGKCEMDFKRPNNNRTFFNELIEEAKSKKINSQITRYKEINLKYEFLSIHKLIHKFKQEGRTDFDDFFSFASRCMQSTFANAEINTQSQHKSSLWYELRYGRVTASKAFEVSRCKTADGTLVSAIIGAHKLKPTKEMSRGTKLEKMVLKVAEEKLSTTFSNSGFFLMCDNPIFGVSPDAITNEYVVEVKCPATNKSLGKYIKNGEISDKFKTQIQLQMMATNRKKGLFIVSKPDFETTKNIIILWVMYDKSFTNNIINKCKDFYEKNIFNKLMSAA